MKVARPSRAARRLLVRVLLLGVLALLLLDRLLPLVPDREDKSEGADDDPGDEDPVVLAKAVLGAEDDRFAVLRRADKASIRGPHLGDRRPARTCTA